MRTGEKIFLVVLAVTLIVVLSLIPTNPKSQAILAKPSPVDWENVQDDPSQKLTVSWQGIVGQTGGGQGSWIERNLESRFNIELAPVFMDVNAYQKRRPLMLIGGDVPDIMWSGDPLTVRVNLRNGFIMELPYEVILKHCPTYVKMVNKYGKEAWIYAQHRGRNYGLPTVNAGADRPRIGCWRMDWLRKVGIDKVPETVEEMHEALRRIRFNDPDGNGQQDTYGWAPNISHWSLAFAEVFAAYDVLPFDLMERDGKIVWGGILPETKQALLKLREWYQEGLLDPDFPIDTQGRNVESGFINGKVGYIYPIDPPSYYQPDEKDSFYGKVRSFDPNAELAPAPPLRDRNGQLRGRSWGGAAHIMQFGKHLENQPEKVVRILEMMEAIACSEELYLEARNGKRGVHWDYNPKAYVRPDGKIQKEGINLLPPYDEKNRGEKNAAELLGGGSTFFFPSSFEPVYDEQLMSSADREWLDRNRRREWGMTNVLGKSDVVPSSGRYLGDLVNYQMTTFIEMVIGKRDVEEFDSFVTEWRRRGGDVILEEANEMAKQIQKIYDLVGVRKEEG
jgi:putative aldouronate transport system substrate-binding protein